MITCASLPAIPRVYHITKLYFSYAIFVTYLVQFYVPMDFLEPPLTVLMGRACGKKYEYHKLTAFRTIIVIITGNGKLNVYKCDVLFCLLAGLAIGIPKLDLFISLIGAFASSALAIIFPPILEILVFYRTNEDRWQKVLWVTKSVIIIVLGMLGFVTGTYVAVRNIANYVSGNE